LHRLAALYAATGDARLVADMTGLPDVGLVLAEMPPSEMPSGVHRAALRTVAAAGRVAADVHEAMADGKIEPHERATIVRSIDELQRAAETAKRAVR
jgi:hypothetical protein